VFINHQVELLLLLLLLIRDVLSADWKQLEMHGIPVIKRHYKFSYQALVFINNGIPLPSYTRYSCTASIGVHIFIQSTDFKQFLQYINLGYTFKSGLYTTHHDCC